MKLQKSEKILATGILLDCTVIAVPLVTFAILSGSASALTEAVRGLLLLSIDVFSLAMMIAINRHRFSRFEFGLEKIQIVVQMVIAISMCLSMLFVGEKILARFEGDSPPPNYLFCLLFAGVSYLNCVINVGVLRAQIRELRTNPSLILRGQVKNRTVMTVGSVVATLSSAAVVIPDPVIFAMIDLGGAIVVLGVIFVTMVRMTRSGILSLIDAPIDEQEKLGIYRKVVERYEDWDELVYLRTRRIGHQGYVEIGLTFDPERPLDSALKSCREIEEAVRAGMQNVFVSVRPAPPLRTAG